MTDLGTPYALTAQAEGLFLSEPTLGVLSLDCDAGYVVKSIDFGFPTVREASSLRSLQDGTYDTTYLVGARAVSLSITLNGRVAPAVQLLDRLRAFCHPMYRPILTYLPVGETAVRQLRVRGADAPAVIDRPRFIDVVAQWVAEDGLQESLEEHCTLVRIGGDPDANGRVYPWDPDRVYPSTGGAIGAVRIVNAGSAPAPWTARMFGGCTNPTLIVNGQRMTFDRNGGLVLAPGESVLVDSARRSIVADSGESRYDRYDFVTGRWPILNPGDNYIAFEAVAATAEAGVQFCWHDRWL